MKIILLVDEKKLGKKGDIIEASEGYAKNYIIPKKIGVVTSLSGAVIRDISRVSKRRFQSVQLVLYPVQVQGEGSAEEVA
ncbi:MAG: hypothetical protein J6Q02_04135, partial [Lachnospiraceae bacterium]|nr:hypothetical protein [Lachnospiraceae bacterium]